jgi:hypothetical protein
LLSTTSILKYLLLASSWLELAPLKSQLHRLLGAAGIAPTAAAPPAARELTGDIIPVAVPMLHPVAPGGWQLHSDDCLPLLLHVVHQATTVAGGKKAEATAAERKAAATAAGNWL